MVVVDSSTTLGAATVVGVAIGGGSKLEVSSPWLVAVVPGSIVVVVVLVVEVVDSVETLDSVGSGGVDVLAGGEVDTVEPGGVAAGSLDSVGGSTGVVVDGPNGNVVGASESSVVGLDGAVLLVAESDSVASVVARSGERTSGSTMSLPEVAGAGPMLPLPPRSGASISRSIDGSESGPSVGCSVCPAGCSSALAVTALMARGAATAAAVNVESDSASKNRPRPVDSPGRCRYIQVRTGGFRC